MDDQDLRNRFGFHSQSRESHATAHELVRQGCYYLSNQLNKQMPDGREKSIVMTKLEEVMFWANAGVARQDGEPDAFLSNKGLPIDVELPSSPVGYPEYLD